ncbi:MAG: D-sedoheptulose 7-phosphate isomerase [Thermodesulfobacteriota bacterium]
MKERIAEIFNQSMELQQAFLRQNVSALEDVVRGLAAVLERGNKVLLFGNGGSAADAQHIAAEFVNKYLIDRPPLAAIALTTDTSILTAIANDVDYESVFDKQIRAIGKAGDAAIGISTSGTSRNVVRGLETARASGLVTIGIGGPPDARMRDFCDHYLTVDGGTTPRIQEVHQVIGHLIVELVDELLFGTRTGPHGVG